MSACKHSRQLNKTSEELHLAESDIVDFSSCLNPTGDPFMFKGSSLDIENLRDIAAAQLKQYPDNRYIELRSAAAHFLGKGIIYNNIIPGNGSCELLRLILECTVKEGDQVIVPVPCPIEYYRSCRIFGAVTQEIELNEMFQLPKRTIEKAKVIILSNPNNPTGKLVSREELSQLASKCAEHQTLLIVDESVIELSDPCQSVADLATGNDHLIVIRSIVNTFALPGIRFSYGIASHAMAELLNSARLSWNIGAVTEAVAKAILNLEGGPDSRYLEESRKFIIKEREYIVERLSSLYGFRPLESSANYILVDMDGHFMDSEKFVKCFETHGILIRDCSDICKGEKRYIRLSVRSREEFEKLIGKLDDVYAESSREAAREKLEETIEHPEKTEAGRGTCSYYPCHFQGQDCTFCFCPFYACEDERTGGFWIDSATGGKVWSCEKCTLMHQPKIAKKVLDVLMEDGDTDENIRKAWKEVITSLI
ncbi:threonine-phosphate decarboxylase [Methanolobus halotolerans]|uniref:Threonine-phosphate decarboxylase n=2 Tax=Methanolobus halotolerans TaxID=2052935 RepID=A0A4E0PX14_9EURY|nr:threonine-phosphate decarboxylase [Methanolobus halotolerans]